MSWDTGRGCVGTGDGAPAPEAEVWRAAGTFPWSHTLDFQGPVMALPCICTGWVPRIPGRNLMNKAGRRPEEPGIKEASRPLI